MATLKITIDSRKIEGKALIDYLFSLAKKSKFVSIESVDTDAKKKEVLENIKEGIIDVKKAQQDHVKLKSAKQMLDEL